MWRPPCGVRPGRPRSAPGRLAATPGTKALFSQRHPPQRPDDLRMTRPSATSWKLPPDVWAVSHPEFRIYRGMDLFLNAVNQSRLCCRLLLAFYCWTLVASLASQGC